ncbi:MAG: phosphoenolpyruvate carboxykinase (ATP), partial [Actinomycetota bacterium]
MNPSVPELVELAISREEGLLTETGALVATTASRTGRSPKDRFLVSLGDSMDQIDWTTNQPIEPGVFDALQQRVRDHLEGRDLFVIDAYIGADPAHRIKLRVITELAWHALFGRQLFRRPTPEEMEGFEPEFVLLSAPTFEAVPDRDGTNSEAFVGLDLERKQVLICGTRYAGEMKKSMFSSGNYLFPIKDGVLGMHCSSN